MVTFHLRQPWNHRRGNRHHLRHQLQLSQIHEYPRRAATSLLRHRRNRRRFGRRPRSRPQPHQIRKSEEETWNRRRAPRRHHWRKATPRRRRRRRPRHLPKRN